MAPRADKTQQTMPENACEAATIVTNLVSKYYWYHINKLRHDPSPYSAPIAETWIPLWLVGQCNHAGKVLAQAVSAYCKREMSCIIHASSSRYTFISASTTWDIDDYIAEAKTVPTIITEKKHVELMERFPPLFPAEPDGSLKILDRPGVITDVHGAILVWSLPKILLPKYLVRNCVAGQPWQY